MKKRHSRRGSSLLLCVVLVVLLGVLGAGYASVVAYHSKSTAAQRDHQQGYAMAASLREALVAATLTLDSNGKETRNPAVNELIQLAAEKYNEYFQLEFELANGATGAQAAEKQAQLHALQQFIAQKDHFTRSATTQLDENTAATVTHEYTLSDPSAETLRQTLTITVALDYQGARQVFSAVLGGDVAVQEGTGGGIGSDYALYTAKSEKTQMKISLFEEYDYQTLAAYLEDGTQGVFKFQGNLEGNLVSKRSVDVIGNSIIDGSVWSAGRVGIKGRGSNITGDIYEYLDAGTIAAGPMPAPVYDDVWDDVIWVDTDGAILFGFGNSISTPNGLQSIDLERRTVIVLGPQVKSVKLLGKIGSEDTASKLFIVSESDSLFLEIGLGCSFYGQMYVPQADVDTHASFTMEGTLTAKTLTGSKIGRLTIYHFAGDYDGDGTPDAPGGKKSPKRIIPSYAWAEEKYYGT